MERVRSVSRWAFLSLGLALLTLTGCATPGGRGVGPTTMQVAQEPYGSEELLNVGVEVFDPGGTDEKTLAKQNTSLEIRQSEVQFMPVHLKNTLEQSGFWGEVRVVPQNASGMDVTVSATILHSNGEELALDVQVVDSQGYTWIDRIYRDRVGKQDYEELRVSKTGPFQNVYNAIANDMAAVRRRLDALSVKRLRRTTELLFAAELVPFAFGEYVRTNKKGKKEVVRLPAEDDPLWRRVNSVAGRNQVFFDAFTATYEPYYRQLWQPYSDWRRYNLVERLSIRQARNDGIKQAAAGIVMIAAAILLEVNDVDNASTLRDVLVIGGTQVIINGVNISQRADIHRETLKELSDSFSSEAKTVRVELEGRTVSLTGTVREQMDQWRELLRNMYEAENTFPSEGS